MAFNDESSFDVIVLGTGLTESITAAALSKAGFKVAHLDDQPHYGGPQASLSLDELVEWANKRGYTVKSRDGNNPIPYSRQYSVSLAPCLIPSIGPLISALIASGVAKYGGFKLLERVAVIGADGEFKSVPGSKEDIFKDSSIRLIDKRRLMKFLAFCMSDGSISDSLELQGKEDQPFLHFLQTTFSLNDEMASAVAYALAFCSSPSDSTLPALLRLQHYLRSSGRYGPSPFLVGHYGSLGEIAQGFCRTAAVSGAVYILGRDLTSMSLVSVQDNNSSSTSHRKYGVSIADFPDTLEADLIITSNLAVVSRLMPRADTIAYPPSRTTTIVRCIAVIDVPLDPSALFKKPSDGDGDNGEEKEVSESIDTVVLVFPPSSLASGQSNSAATVLMTGEGSMSAPTGKSIVYISLPLIDVQPEPSAEDSLQPYLSAVLSKLTLNSSPVQPILEVYYKDVSHSPITLSETTEAETILVSPPLETHPFPVLADEAAKNSERLFWDAVKVLRRRENAEVEQVIDFWPPLEEPED
ncbi:FAD/NAD-P-binding domain-containing protein [Flagelloscypha sp. PMI_526]|nr:FAD/NAD-P-binding domain-containing protein [Flagelloscypha sp. PMI_526]